MEKRSALVSSPCRMWPRKKVLTIEGLSANRSHPVQLAWIAEQAPQNAGTANPAEDHDRGQQFLQKHPHPTPIEVGGCYV